VPEFNKDAIVQAARDAAANVEGPLSRSQFETLTGISQYHIYKAFPEGEWSEVKRLAGLERHPKDNEPLSDDQLLAEYYRIASEVRKIPTWSLFASKATFSPDTIRKRFGGLQGVLRRYVEWLEQNDPGSPIIPLLNARSKHEIPTPPSISNVPETSRPFAWAKT
jgi:hypothetical protein